MNHGIQILVLKLLVGSEQICERNPKNPNLVQEELSESQKPISFPEFEGAGNQFGPSCQKRDFARNQKISDQGFVIPTGMIPICKIGGLLQNRAAKISPLGVPLIIFPC